MNYRHHFHAGNFADVMKHVLLLELLALLTRKDKPLRYLDTHAGAGQYDLSQGEAQRSGEYLEGIHRLMQLKPSELQAAPASVQQYLGLIRQQRELQGKGYYPGSPQLALHGLRDQDRATLFEMHDAVFPLLRQQVRDRRVSSQQRDMYEALPASVPPPEKRGLVLIDPPYELERKDFPQLVELLQHTHQRWPTGVYALWYPIKDRAMLERFEKKMLKTGIRRQLICELLIWPDDTPVGLNGCGLLVINPPWQFADQAQAALEWLAPRLEQQPQAGRVVVRWLVGE